MDNDRKPAQYDAHYTANRLSRAIGHIKLVRCMVEDGADCTEVLIQFGAILAGKIGRF